MTYRVKQTVRFRHDTMGEQKIVSHPGSYTLPELKREVDSFADAGWHLVNREDGDPDCLQWRFESGIVTLILEADRE